MEDNFATGYMLGSDNKNGGGFFGGDGIWGFLLFALIFGGGYGGFGGFGGGYGLQGMVTRADINEGFALNNITGGIHSLERGLCDGFYNVSHQISDCLKKLYTANKSFGTKYAVGSCAA